MHVFRYETEGGKDVIINYVDKLPKRERATYYAIQAKLEEDGLKASDSLTTRQLRKKLWEIKATKNRYMYVLADEDNISILHACRKQKGKAEKFELSKAIKRAEELGKELGKSFV